MKDRIAHIMRAKNLKASDFAALLGIQPSGISHILAGRNQPSLEFVKKIKENFPEYNLDWIIFGTGPMTSSEPYRTAFVEAQKEVNNASPQEETLSMPGLFDSDVQDSSPSQPHLDVTEQPVAPQQSSEPLLSDSFSSSVPSAVKRMIFVYEDGTFETFVPR